MAEINFGGELGEGLDAAAGVVVAGFEGLEGVEGAAAEAHGGGEFGPVDLRRCVALGAVSRGSVTVAMTFRHDIEEAHTVCAAMMMG